MGVLHRPLLLFFLKLIIKRKRALLMQHMPQCVASKHHQSVHLHKTYRF